MLKQSKSVTLNGKSIIDGQETARFNVTIPTGENETPQFSIYVNDGELYQKNLEKVWADRDEFEKAVREPESDEAEEAPTSKAETDSSTAVTESEAEPASGAAE